MTNSVLGTALEFAGRRVPLKWHRLRRGEQDKIFSANVLKIGAQLGASMEVDLRVTRDGDFVVLHDAVLDRETCGRGPVSSLNKSDLSAICYRSANGSPAHTLLFARDLAAALVTAQPDTCLQLDMKDDFSQVETRAIHQLSTVFSECENKIVVSGDSTKLTLALADRLPQMRRGLEPSFRLIKLYESGHKAALEGQLLSELRGTLEPHIVYLNWQLVLAAKSEGIDLIEICHDEKVKVDVWTFPLSVPRAGFTAEEARAIRALLELGADQVTTDEAIALEEAFYAINGLG